MKFNKWTLGLAAIAASLFVSVSANAQSIASGVLGGSSGVPNVPSILATVTQTNLPAATGNSIDLRANRIVCVGMSFNGSSSATGVVTANFAPSFDGVTVADANKTISLAVTGTGVTMAHGSTNIDSFAYPYYIPVSITNNCSVTISNLVVEYSTKNGS